MVCWQSAQVEFARVYFVLAHPFWHPVVLLCDHPPNMAMHGFLHQKDAYWTPMSHCAWHAQFGHFGPIVVVPLSVSDWQVPRWHAFFVGVCQAWKGKNFQEKKPNPITKQLTTVIGWWLLCFCVFSWFPSLITSTLALACSSPNSLLATHLYSPDWFWFEMRISKMEFPSQLWNCSSCWPCFSQWISGMGKPVALEKSKIIVNFLKPFSPAFQLQLIANLDPSVHGYLDEFWRCIFWHSSGPSIIWQTNEQHSIRHIFR